MLGVRVAVTPGEEGLLVMKCYVLFWVCLRPESSPNFMTTSDLCASLDVYSEYNRLLIDQMGIVPRIMYSVH